MFTQPPIQRAPWALSTVVKRPIHESDYSPPSKAEVKNPRSYNRVHLPGEVLKRRDPFAVQFVIIVLYYLYLEMYIPHVYLSFETTYSQVDKVL
jgi:hypothetical protein